MLRITEHYENEKTLRLRLDGTVDEASCAELQNAWSQGNEDSDRTVIIDMAGVMFMSAEAAGQIAMLRDSSLHIVNCSPFIEMLLNSAINSQTTKGQ